MGLLDLHIGLNIWWMDWFKQFCKFGLHMAPAESHVEVKLTHSLQYMVNQLLGLHRALIIWWMGLCGLYMYMALIFWWMGC